MRSPLSVTSYLRVFKDTMAVFFDLSPDLLIELDQHGAIVRVNPAFQTVTGYRESEVLRWEVRRIVLQSDWALFVHAFEPGGARLRFHVLHKDRGTIAVRLMAHLLKHQTRQHHVIYERGYLILRVDDEP